MRIRRLPAVLALLVAMCGAGVAVPAAAATPTQDLTPEEVISDLDTAVLVTDAWWSQHWSQMFTGTYQAPLVVGLYDASDPNSAPWCTDSSGPHQLDAGAFHCPDPSGNFVAWDATFMSRAFELGDSFLYMVVAHEWGHAIQYQLSEELQTPDAELQADCLAGAALYGAAADGTLIIEEGDEKEIANGLSNVADEFAWGDPSHHGDPFQRIAAFNQGRTQGPISCLPGTQS